MNSQEHRKVYLAYDPEMQGVITDAGPEQSEVKFQDGVRRFIMNKFLLDVITGDGMPGDQVVQKAKKEKSERLDYKSYRIKVLVEGNPRSPTAKAFTKWQQMKDYIRAKPNASVAEVAKETLYKIGDFNWDRERGNVGVEKL